MTIHKHVHPLHLVVRDLPELGVVRGGPGSGFYGHAGRPGEVGGSAPGGGGGAATKGDHKPYGRYPVHGVASHIAKLQREQGQRGAETREPGSAYAGSPRSRGMQAAKASGHSDKFDSIAFNTQNNPFGGDRVTIATVHGWMGSEEQARELRAALKDQGLRTVFYVKTRGGGEFADSEYAR